MTRAALVLAQGLEQVVFPLVGQPRYTILPGEIRAVADVASMLLGKGAALLHPRSLARISRRAWRRQGGDEIGCRLQILIAELFRQGSHRFGDAQTFAEHEQLDERVG